MFCRLYRAASRRWGPQGLTLSAFAFKHAQETGDTRLRNFIDGLWMVFANTQGHCQGSFQRESRINHEQ